MRTRLPATIVAVALALFPTLSTSQTAVEETPAFPSGIEVVTVDAVVVDKEGRAVPGFTAADFTVLEDGVPQTITRFQALELPPLPPKVEDVEERLPVSSNQEPIAKGVRTFVLIFDEIHLTPGHAPAARAAVGEFLRAGVREGDRVVLIGTAGGTWWSTRMPDGREELIAILNRLDGRYIPESSPDRMTDYEAMRIMVYDDPDVGYQVERRFDAYGSLGREREGDRQYRDTLATNSHVGIIDPYVRSKAQDVYRQAVERRRITMRVMTKALQALTGIQGRKAMVLVSQGFIHEPDFKEMKELVAASMRVNVPVHFIDARGLKALPDFMTAAFQGANLDVQDTVAVLADITYEAEGSVSLALDTGGLVVRNTNDLTSGIQRVSAESQAYYLLGYSSTNTSRDGKFRKIEVKLDRTKSKGLKVRARRGYFAREEGSGAEPQHAGDPEIMRALDSPFERPEIPIRVSTFSFDEAATAGRVNVVVAAEIDIGEVDVVERDGRFDGSIEYVTEWQHLETGHYDNLKETIEMAMRPDTLDRLKKEGYTVSRELTVSPGTYQLKVVVKDPSSGRLGSVIHEFVVPEATAFRVSTPLLSDALEPRDTGAQGLPRPVLRVRRSFAPGSTMWVQFAVFGAEKDDTSYLPQVMAGYEIRRKDGSVFKSTPDTIINPTSIGALLRLHGINLTGASPGDYELVLRVRDSLAGRRLEVREPFSITAG
jgi:VWFA-related protein